MGKEKFVVLAESDVDTNGDPIHRQVASGSIQIWPRAQGKITGSCKVTESRGPCPMLIFISMTCIQTAQHMRLFTRRGEPGWQRHPSIYLISS